MRQEQALFRRELLGEAEHREPVLRRLKSNESLHKRERLFWIGDNSSIVFFTKFWLYRDDIAR